MEASKQDHKSFLAVKLGLFTNAFLAVMKTFMGIIGHSPALLADGINSTSDVAYYIIVQVFMRLAGKPADDEHPYGHKQMESIAALVVGAFVLTTAIAIFWDSVNKVYDLCVLPSSASRASIGALAAIILTIIIKIILTNITTRIGRQTKNPAVFALAYDHRNDIFAASAATIGIFLGRLGFAWVDPLAGAVVAVVILRTGIEIMRQSSGDLMDTVPGKALEQEVRAVIRGINGVWQIEEILAHRFGPYIVMNITVGVDGLMSVAQGDKIATDIERSLHEKNELLKKVYVHYHPACPVKKIKI